MRAIQAIELGKDIRDRKGLFDLSLDARNTSCINRAYGKLSLLFFAPEPGEFLTSLNPE